MTLTTLTTPFQFSIARPEHIFSSSIETINTVGNVLFTENVAKFYLSYAILCNGFKDDMQHLFAQCQQMMDVSDEEN